MENIKYVGDGVYVLFDGHGVCLKANDHLNPTDEIYLDRSVLEELVRIAKSWGVLTDGP